MSERRILVFKEKIEFDLFVQVIRSIVVFMSIL